MLNSNPMVINIKTETLHFDTVETLMGFLNAGGPEARQEVKKQCIKRIAVGYQLRGQEPWNSDRFRSITRAVNCFGMLEKLFPIPVRELIMPLVTLTEVLIFRPKGYPAT